MALSRGLMTLALFLGIIPVALFLGIIPGSQAGNFSVAWGGGPRTVRYGTLRECAKRMLHL